MQKILTRTRVANKARWIDPFDYGTTSVLTRKNSFSKGFDADFSNTFPLAKSKHEKDNTKFDTDFVKAFSDDNRNIKSIDYDAFSNMKTKTVDIDEAFSTKKTIDIDEAFSTKKTMGIDEAFSTKSEKFGRKQGQDSIQNKSKGNINDRKLKTDINKIWNGGGTPLALTEEEQFVLASQQSLKSEEERRKRKQKEDADLALALELSKQERSEKL